MKKLLCILTLFLSGISSQADVHTFYMTNNGQKVVENRYMKPVVVEYGSDPLISFYKCDGSECKVLGDVRGYRKSELISAREAIDHFRYAELSVPGATIAGALYGSIAGAPGVLLGAGIGAAGTVILTPLARRLTKIYETLSTEVIEGRDVERRANFDRFVRHFQIALRYTEDIRQVHSSSKRAQLLLRDAAKPKDFILETKAHFDEFLNDQQ